METLDIDDSFLITIHHWMKWYKFGFTRTFDNLSIEIRNRRLTREEALKYISEEKIIVPKSDIERFTEFANISEEYFFEIAEKFRNMSIWKKNNYGSWYLPDFILDNWDW